MSGMDLVEFLKARLDEDEQAARDAHYEGQRWISEEEGVWRWPDDEAVHTADRKRDAAHIARHDPAHVLADVAAKRRVVERLAFVESHGPAVDHVRALDMSTGAVAALRDVIAMLALPYADHPDYRQEWKP